MRRLRRVLWRPVDTALLLLDPVPSETAASPSEMSWSASRSGTSTFGGFDSTASGTRWTPPRLVNAVLSRRKLREEEAAVVDDWDVALEVVLDNLRVDPSLETWRFTPTARRRTLSSSTKLAGDRFIEAERARSRHGPRRPGTGPSTNFVRAGAALRQKA